MLDYHHIRLGKQEIYNHYELVLIPHVEKNVFLIKENRAKLVTDTVVI